MAREIGVLLSGCGAYDGTETHEAVLTLLFLDRAGAVVRSMAPDMDQFHVIDHLVQQPSKNKRRVLVESARIARGDIQDIKKVQADQIDGLIIPGGFGTVKNISDFAINGPECSVHPDVRRLLMDMAALAKPIGAMSIATATVVRVLSAISPLVTIGNDPGTAAGIASMGGVHCDCGVSDICVDEAHRIVTTPAYMLGPTIKDVAAGIEKLVDRVLSLC